MGDYEKNQNNLQKLWDEMMSDEEEPFGGGGTSDEYSPGNSSESESDSEDKDRELMKKKRRIILRKKVPLKASYYKSHFAEGVPSTSAASDLPDSHSDQVEQPSAPGSITSSDPSTEDHSDTNVENNNVENNDVEQTLNNSSYGRRVIGNGKLRRRSAFRK